jgi:hypothetical protein
VVSAVDPLQKITTTAENDGPQHWIPVMIGLYTVTFLEHWELSTFLNDPDLRLFAADCIILNYFLYSVITESTSNFLVSPKSFNKNRRELTEWFH